MLSNQQNLNSEDQDSITSGNNNSFMQSTFNYKFNNVPFYEVIEDIIKPTLLKSSGKCTLENSPSGLMECAFNHTMSNEQATLISLNRDFTKKTADFVYQYQIRICQSEVGRSEVTDYLPLGLHIRIENETCSLPPIARYIQSGTEYRRVGRPINCTQHLKLSPLVSNSIIVNWIPDEKNYAFAMFIVKELNANTLIKKLQEKEARSSEETINDIKKLAEVNPCFATASFHYSLKCPLSTIRMKIPAKSIHCDHLQCFNAGTYILKNKMNPTWLCPICNKSCLYDDLQVQNYFLEIVTSPRLQNDVQDIEIFADGSWIIPEEKNFTENIIKKAPVILKRTY